jgi:hypothetical protein
MERIITANVDIDLSFIQKGLILRKDKKIFKDDNASHILNIESIFFGYECTMPIIFSNKETLNESFEKIKKINN